MAPSRAIVVDDEVMEPGVSPENGWWQASDGRWYPPQQHPDPAHRQRFGVPASTPPPGPTWPPPGAGNAGPPPVGPPVGGPPVGGPPVGGGPFGPPPGGWVPSPGSVPPGPGVSRKGPRWPLIVGVSLAVVAILAVVLVRVVPRAERAREAADRAADRDRAETGDTVDEPGSNTTRRRSSTSVAPAEPPSTTTTAPVRGGRQAPLAMGEPFRITYEDGAVEVVVTSFTADALAPIQAENQFNDPPPPGQQYALVGLTATYRAGPSQATMPGLLSALRVSVFGQSAVELNTYSCSAVIPDRLDSFSELLDGGTLSGNECVLLPIADAAGPVLLRAEESICFTDCDEIWVRLQ